MTPGPHPPCVHDRHGRSRRARSASWGPGREAAKLRERPALREKGGSDWPGLNAIVGTLIRALISQRVTSLVEGSFDPHREVIGRRPWVSVPEHRPRWR